MTPAERVLERLLRRGERARSRGASEQVTLAMTASTCPEYCTLDALESLEAFHAEIALAERAGAVMSFRTRSGGDSAGLRRLTLVDLDKLGLHLGVRLLSDRTLEASTLLGRWQSTYPVISHVLQRWSQGKQVRGCGPEAASLVMDAIRAVESRRRDEQEERILRRESVRLYSDSKRLERLTPWLDLLTTGELAASGLSNEDVWASLGLRREPQPMLVAGSGIVKLRDGTLPLCKPYLGLPVDAVESIETEARYLLTIENLASFHDAARAMPDANGLLIYTAGMPSPAWRSLYRRVINALPSSASIYHWGDIDEGGFRIAAALSRIARDSGRCLQPWLMSPDAVPTHTSTRTPPSKTILQEMVRWANFADWAELALELQKTPMRIEQEAIDPSFPDETRELQIAAFESRSTNKPS